MVIQHSFREVKMYPRRSVYRVSSFCRIMLHGVSTHRFLLFYIVVKFVEFCLAICAIKPKKNSTNCNTKSFLTSSKKKVQVLNKPTKIVFLFKSIKLRLWRFVVAKNCSISFNILSTESANKIRRYNEKKKLKLIQQLNYFYSRLPNHRVPPTCRPIALQQNCFTWFKLIINEGTKVNY